MPQITHRLHTAELTNNCPKCFSNSGLQIEISQNETDTKLYSKASKDLNAQLHCNTCDSDIFPVDWDTDLERVVEYHLKKADPITSSLQLKPLAYILILIDAVTIGFIIYYLK